MLGVSYSEGKGVAPDCLRAASFLRRFVEEKSLWSDQMTVAARALDDGGLGQLMDCTPTPPMIRGLTKQVEECLNASKTRLNEGHPLS